MQKLNLSYQHIFAIAVPVVLANLAMPIQSAIDIAVVGHFDHASSLAGLGIAVQLLSLILVSLNFLQYASSGLAAQALGKLKADTDNPPPLPITTTTTDTNTKNSTDNPNLRELKHILQRSLLLAIVLGVVILLCRPVLVAYGLKLLAATADNQVAATTYLDIRMYGVMFELMNYAFIGWFAGQGLSKFMLYQQSFIALANILLTLFFVYVMDFGLSGVALGTLMAYVMGILLAVTLACRRLNITVTAMFKVARTTFDHSKMLRLFSLNKDIFIRTLLLTLSLTWITRLSALQGDLVLATNAVLLQVLSMSAYALDGVAVAAESLSGQAVSHHKPSLFKQAVKRTGVVIFVLASVLSVLWYAFMPLFINTMTDIKAVVVLAHDYRLIAALLPLIGAGAYWLDGVMFGLTAGRLIRHAALIMAFMFFPVSYALYSHFNTQDLAMWAIWGSVYWLLLLRFAINGWLLWRNQSVFDPC